MRLWAILLPALGAYATAIGCIMAYFLSGASERVKDVGFLAFYLSLILSLVDFFLSMGLPDNMPFILIFFLMTNVLFLLVARKWKIEGVAAFLFPPYFIILLAHILSLGVHQKLSLHFSNPWFYLHLLSFLFSLACFTSAAASSLMYLCQARYLKKKQLKGAFLRLPPLAALDGASYRFIGLGFPILALGVFSGSLWSHIYTGSYWSFKSGGITAAAIIVLYLISIHLRMINRWQGVRVNFMLVASFFIMIIAVLVVGHMPLWVRL